MGRGARTINGVRRGASAVLDAMSGLGKGQGMKTAVPPNPLLAFLAAVLAHIAYLQAPDAIGHVATSVWYVLVLTGVVYFFWFVLYLDLGRFGHPVARVISQGLVMVGLVLILVGAGYSTNVEPTVLKLAGVLPLGWSCSVIVLLKEQARMLAQKEAHRRTPRKLNWSMGVLVVATIVQFAGDLSDHGKGTGTVIKWGLQLWLFLGVFDLGLTWFRMIQALRVKKD